MFTDPFTTFGIISIPFLVSNLLTLLGFILATFFALKYTKLFYGKRQKPNSWILIVSGLLFISIAEIGQFLLPYRLEPLLIEVSLILAVQSIGVILVAIGCFLLYLEVPT